MMLTYKGLFWSRVKAYYLKQWHVLKLIADWIVVIYIGVPILIFLGVNHYLWWQEVPGWSTFFSLSLFLLFVNLLFLNGQIQVFYDSADVVFLVKKSEWLHQLMIRGLFFSFVRDVLFIIIITLYFAPLFLLRFNFSWYQVGLQGVIFLLTKQVLGYFYHLLNFIVEGFFLSFLHWVVKLLYIGLVTFCTARYPQDISLILLAIVEGFLLVGLISYRLSVKGKIQRDIHREEKWNDRFLTYFVGKMGGARKTAVTMKRPILFRRSQRFFKKMTPTDGLAELMIKNRLRDGRSLLFYLQIIVYSVIAIILFPSWLKFIIFFGVTLLFAYWLKGSLSSLSDHGFVNLFNLDEVIKWEALRKAYSLLLWGGLFIQMAALTFSLYGWIGFLIGCPVLYLYQKVLVNGMLIVK